MEQVENKIFTALKAAITKAHSGTLVLGEYTPTPNKFPCVFIEEADNYAQLINCSNVEQVTAVMYEINVYSNAESGRKTECKNIMKTIDTYMTGVGFRRTMLQPIPNEDVTIYRMTARYTGAISNNTVYRR